MSCLSLHFSFWQVSISSRCFFPWLFSDSFQTDDLPFLNCLLWITFHSLWSSCLLFPLMNSSASVCLVCFPFSSFAKLSVLPILQHHLLTTFIFTLTISSSMYQSIHFPDELTSPLLTPSVYFPLLHLYTNSFIFQPLSLIHLISITLLPSLELLPNSLPTSITSTNKTPYPPYILIICNIYTLHISYIN